MFGEYLSKCLENVFGYLWPAYRTYKTLEEGQYDATRQWCIYWGVFGTLSVCEQILDKFLFWVPLYHEFKVAFVVWLWHEKFKGAQYIYYCWVLPWLRQNEHLIDQKVEEFKQKVLQLIVSHSARFSAYLKEGFYNIIILLHNMQDEAIANKNNRRNRNNGRLRYYTSTVRGSQDGQLEYDDEEQESDSRYNTTQFEFSETESNADNFDMTQNDADYSSDYEFENNTEYDLEYDLEDDDDDDDEIEFKKKIPPRKRIIEEYSLVRQVRSQAVYKQNNKNNNNNNNLQSIKDIRIKQQQQQQQQQQYQYSEKQRIGRKNSIKNYNADEFQRSPSHKRQQQYNMQQQLQIQNSSRRSSHRRKQGSGSGRDARNQPFQ